MSKETMLDKMIDEAVQRATMSAVIMVRAADDQDDLEARVGELEGELKATKEALEAERAASAVLRNATPAAPDDDGEFEQRVMAALEVIAQREVGAPAPTIDLAAISAAVRAGLPAPAVPVKGDFEAVIVERDGNGDARRWIVKAR